MVFFQVFYLNIPKYFPVNFTIPYFLSILFIITVIIASTPFFASLFDIFLISSSFLFFKSFSLLIKLCFSIISSSSKTNEYPSFSKELAFKTWSPLLIFFDSGIRSVGFFNANNSKITFAPALDITKSAALRKCGKSSLTYSNCLYPSKFSNSLSKFPFPQIWITLKLFNISLIWYLTSSFILLAPKLPPMTSMISLLFLNLHISKALCLFRFSIYSLIGVPVKTPFPSFI